ncbi:MAG: hypothetical protein IT340_13285 [Chloroflexi bacterium]|nr:hypothetical protein [Chloroflexota bacterium]
MYARDVTFLPLLAFGPGRYDPVFEEGNVDYPIGCVRWTERRAPMRCCAHQTGHRPCC